MLRGQAVDRIPPGWYSSDQIRRAADISQGYVHRYIKALKERGVVTDVRNFRVEHLTRSPTPVPHFRIDDANAADLGLIPSPEKTDSPKLP